MKNSGPVFYLLLGEFPSSFHRPYMTFAVEWACSSSKTTCPWRTLYHSSPPHLTYLLTLRVVGAPQRISQPTSSIFLCSPLPSETWRTPDPPIPRCCLPTSSSVCLVFFPLLTCFARWFWPDLMNGRHVRTTADCISLRWSGGLRAVH